MRDVAVVSFAHSTSPKELAHNEVEMIVPVVREAVAASGRDNATAVVIEMGAPEP